MQLIKVIKFKRTDSIKNHDGFDKKSDLYPVWLTMHENCVDIKQREPIKKPTKTGGPAVFVFSTEWISHTNA
jgi:hypothetical protein